jgi:hypothetical protein
LLEHFLRHLDLDHVEDGVAAWGTTLALIFTSFSRRLVSEHCATASGNASVGMKLARLWASVCN